MSGASTPRSEPAAPLPGNELTPIVPDAVNDLFDLAAPPVEAPLIARLVPVAGGNALSSLVAVPVRQDQGTVTLGRSKDLLLPFRIDGVAKLSGRHCNLTLDPVTLRVTLTDTSANGTCVNGTRVAKDTPVVLHAGDTVSLTRPASASNGDGDEHVEFMFQRLKEETDVKTMIHELTCGICLQIYHRPVSCLPCMHVFCASCMTSWLREGKTTCAECRLPMDELRPTHKIQSCVEQLLLADPSHRRPVEEIRELDAQDDIPPAGKVLRKRVRADGSDGGDGDDEDDEEGSNFSNDSDGEGPARLLAAGAHYMAMRYPLQHAQGHCPQCTNPSTLPDGFQCVEGGPHLCCNGCRRLFPERPQCGRPQRCHLCSGPFCGRYYAGEAVQRADGSDSCIPTRCPAEQADTPAARLLQPLADFTFSAIPPSTFGGNTTEISILTTYLANKGTLAPAVWATCAEKLRAGEWKPDLPSVNGPVTADSPVCRQCSTRVFTALLFHYRRAIPSAELPESVTCRSSCWYGVNCRTQFHKAQHAQGYNHVCYQEKRKE